MLVTACYLRTSITATPSWSPTLAACLSAEHEKIDRHTPCMTWMTTQRLLRSMAGCIQPCAANHTTRMLRGVRCSTCTAGGRTWYCTLTTIWTNTLSFVLVSHLPSGQTFESHA